MELRDEQQLLQALGWRLGRSSVEEVELGGGQVQVFDDVLGQ